MIKTKTYSKIISILFVSALLLWPFAAAAQTPQVTYLSADFGDVLVDTTETIIASITNTKTADPFLFYFFWPNNLCGFSATGDLGLALYPNDSTEIVIEWTPSEGDCTAELHITDGGRLAAVITVSGKGILDLPENEMPGMQTLLDSFDAWVEWGDIVGKGPGKSAENRLKAFRNMLVEADTAVEQERIEEAYGQLSAARKKIGEFVQDGAGIKTMTTMSGAATSATSDLRNKMDLVLESLRQ